MKAQAQTSGYEVRKMAVVDRNNTDQPDIVFVGENRSNPSDHPKLFYMQNSNGSFSQPREFEQQIRYPYNLFKGDLDGDQLEDLIVIDEGTGMNNGGIFFSKNKNGIFQPFEKLPDYL